MEDLLRYIITHIVSDPSTVEITSAEENGELVYYVSIPQEERGVVIGKEGRNIKSVRNLVSILAKKEGKRVFVKIKD